MHLTVRPATESDLPALTHLDLTYPADRVLALERTGNPPQHAFTLRWHHQDAPDAVYSEYPEDFLRDALSRADLFLVAEVEGQIAGLLIVLAPTWTDAAEITDLAVHRPLRGRGGGRALVEASTVWARRHSFRALWVEPRADNHDAVVFYLTLGFRLSGFNDRLYSNQDHEPGRTTLYMHLELV